MLQTSKKAFRDINLPELTHGKHGLRIQTPRGWYNDVICTSQVTKSRLVVLDSDDRDVYVQAANAKNCLSTN